jgi:hypothetical protein
MAGVIRRTRVLGKPISSLDSVERDVYMEYERRKKGRNSIGSYLADACVHRLLMRIEPEHDYAVRSLCSSSFPAIALAFLIHQRQYFVHKAYRLHMNHTSAWPALVNKKIADVGLESWLQILTTSFP